MWQGENLEALFIPFGDAFVCIVLSHVYLGADLSGYCFFKLLILTLGKGVRHWERVCLQFYNCMQIGGLFSFFNWKRKCVAFC